jgi:hypothetical protein
MSVGVTQMGMIRREAAIHTCCTSWWMAQQVLNLHLMFTQPYACLKEMAANTFDKHTARSAKRYLASISCVCVAEASYDRACSVHGLYSAK